MFSYSKDARQSLAKFLSAFNLGKLGLRLKYKPTMKPINASIPMKLYPNEKNLNLPNSLKLIRSASLRPLDLTAV